MKTPRKHWARLGRYATRAPWVAWCGSNSKVFALVAREVTCPACRVWTEGLVKQVAATTPRGPESKECV